MNDINPTTAIRWANASDVGEIVRLIKALAEFENEPASSVKVTEADLLRDGFGDPGDGAGNFIPRFECLIAEHDGKAVGICRSSITIPHGKVGLDCISKICSWRTMSAVSDWGGP